MRFRNRVRQIRVLRGMTQTALAQAAGISRMTLRQIERDEGHVPTGHVILALSLALDDTALFWVERTGEEQSL